MLTTLKKISNKRLYYIYTYILTRKKIQKEKILPTTLILQKKPQSSIQNSTR